ncbi:MAG: Uma2 family endonuclease [Aeromicrobium sp.]|uniref:Uma2 family endonuclease n=1 Tax=Aeromicrobium sp. TaxID=1871063 RepID=UPI0039E71AB0
MTSEPLTLPQRRHWTRDALERLPDDGNRYELIDGTLIVSPAPARVHQRASKQLFLLLHAGASAGLEVFYAPFDVAMADDTVMQPDLLVAPSGAFTDRNLPTAPLLAVEILSPSTRGVDLLLKKERLQRGGCPHYWVVDPDAPSITAWTLIDGTYVEAGAATGDETLTLTAPFDVSIVPADLIKP